MNYYRVLGLPFNADRKDVKIAFRRLAKECHPDLHPNDPGAEARFREINEAYETLYDPVARKKYHAILAGFSRKKPRNPRSAKGSSQPGPRPLTPEEQQRIREQVAEIREARALGKKVMTLIWPAILLLNYAVLLHWAWRNDVLTLLYGIVMFIASAFLALPLAGLIWLGATWWRTKKRNKR